MKLYFVHEVPLTYHEVDFSEQEDVFQHVLMDKLYFSYRYVTPGLYELQSLTKALR